MEIKQRQHKLQFPQWPLEAGRTIQPPTDSPMLNCLALIHTYKKLQYNFHFIASLWEGLFFLAHLFKLSQNFTKVCIIGGVATIAITDRYVLTQV